MKRTSYLWMMVCCIGLLICSAGADVIVYEGFDYIEGTVIAGQGTATAGWDGAWNSLTPGDWPYEVTTGVTFGALPVTGGSAHRLKRYGNTDMNRLISSSSQAALTVDNSTVWFSVLMAPRSESSLTAGGPGYVANSWGAIVFGDAALTSGASWNAPPIAAGGNAVGVGFGGRNGGSGNDYTLACIQGVTYKDGAYTQSAKLTIGDTLVLIVGQIDWAPNGTNDVLSLYNIVDPTAALPEAFVTMEVDLDQSAFNVVSMGQGQCELFDEIRFGESYNDVVPGPSPAVGESVAADSSLALSWINVLPVDSNDVYVDVWFGTDPNVTTGDMVKVLAAPTEASKNATTVNVDASVAGTYYWWVDSYLNGPDHINEPNLVAGPLYYFEAVDDLAPSVVIDTVDKMTWSGEGVPLTATVTDDDQSPVTISWAADATSQADPNLLIEIADGGTETPAVTITKDAEGLGLRTVTMTVSVTDGSNLTPATASVEIDVYDDACQMTRLGQGLSAVTDFNNDCVTNLLDFLELADVWLDDYALTAPVVK